MSRTRKMASLCAAFAILTASCGSDDPTDDAVEEPEDGVAVDDEAPSDGEAPIDGEATQAPTADDVTLEVWSWLPNDHPEGPGTYDEIFSNFEAMYPNVTIDLTAMPYPTFWDTWSNAAIAGTGPDVISMYGGATAVAYADSLIPMQDLLSTETTDDLRFLESSVSPDGNLYAVPAGAYAYYLLANETLLADAGLDAATAFGDWESLLSTCATLAEAGTTPIASGWSDGYVVENYMYVFMSQLLDPESFDQWVNAELELSDPRFEDAMNRLVEMIDADCFSDASEGMTLYNDAFDEAVSGDAASVVVGGIDTALSAEENNGAGSMTALAFPQLPGSEYDNVSDAGPNQGWSVTSFSDNREFSTLLVEHIVSAESQELLWENTQLPPNRFSLDVTSDSVIVTEFLDIIEEPENHTVFMAFTDPALAVFQREASNLIAGRTEPADILHEANEAQQRALSDLDG